MLATVLMQHYANKMTGPKKLPHQIHALLREPLVHFLIAGLLIFLISMWRGGGVDPESRTIIITEDKVARLSASWEQVWRRAPTQSEIDGLIRDYIKEEVYYREARRLGLDEDDTVIRRRLRSKMEFLAGAQTENAVADDATLQRWLDRHPERFVSDAAFSFDQIYLGENATDDGGPVLKMAASGEDWRSLGKAISLPKSIDDLPRSDIERQFGDLFTKALSTAPQDSWTGPVRSGFGYHLIRKRKVTPSGKAKLADVRQAVENDWRVNSVKAREAAAYQTLLDGYDIRIAKP